MLITLLIAFLIFRRDQQPIKVKFRNEQYEGHSFWVARKQILSAYLVESISDRNCSGWKFLTIRIWTTVNADLWVSSHGIDDDTQATVPHVLSKYIMGFHLVRGSLTQVENNMTFEKQVHHIPSLCNNNIEGWRSETIHFHYHLNLIRANNVSHKI